MATWFHGSTAYLRAHSEHIGRTLVLLLLCAISLYRYVLFHSLVEIFTVVVAWCVFLVYWNTRRFLGDGYFLFLGIAYLCIGGLDLLHALAYPGMGVFPDNDGNLSYQLWIAARCMESVSLLVACAFLGRRLSLLTTAATYAGIFVLLLATIFVWPLFPACFVDGARVTAFKTASNFVLCGILLASIGLLFRKRSQFDPHAIRLIVAAIVVAIASELTLGCCAGPQGIGNFAGHVLRLVFVYLMYCAFLEQGLRRPYDVIERDLNRHEQTLRQSEQRYRSLVEHIHLGITLVDRDFRVQMINESHARMIGRTATQCLGLECFRIFEKRGAACAHCPGVRAMNSGHSEEVVTRGVRDDGTTYDARVQAFPIFDPQGKPEGFIELVEDITERVRTERELIKAKQRAEEGTRAKSEFLANMSHEIRTPMTAILGFADILLDSLSSPECVDAARTIKRNGEHLLTVINDILDLSKIEAGKVTAEWQVCFPAAIVADTVSLMQVRAAAKSLSLEVEYVGPLPDAILSDPTRLRQILINLIGNAIKFTEAGKVRVVVRLLQGPEEQATMRFDVIDTGIGMNAEEVGRLFQPFTQGDTTTTRRFGGTGLGLTISKRLAQVLGGDISVTSEPGKGSAFTLTIDAGLHRLPLKDAGTAAPPQALPADGAELRPPSRLTCRLLLAEDGPDNQRLVAILLRKAGAKVTVVENGQAAVELALAAREQERPFDVILMDIQMPVLDGYEATRRLRAAGYTGAIIALTAHAMTDDRQKCLDAGCDDYLSKPLNRNTLIDTVAKYAAREPMRQEAVTEGDNGVTFS